MSQHLHPPSPEQSAGLESIPVPVQPGASPPTPGVHRRSLRLAGALVIVALSAVGLATTLAPEVDWAPSLLKAARRAGSMTEGTARSDIYALLDKGPATSGEIVHVDGGFHAMGA